MRYIIRDLGTKKFLYLMPETPVEMAEMAFTAEQWPKYVTLLGGGTGLPANTISVILKEGKDDIT